MRSATMDATMRYVYENYANSASPYRWGAAVLGGVPLAALAAMGEDTGEAMDAMDAMVAELPSRYAKPAMKIRDARLSHEFYRSDLACAVRESCPDKLLPARGPGDLVFILAGDISLSVVIEPLDAIVIHQAILPRDMGMLMSRLQEIEEFRESWVPECTNTALPDFDVHIGYDSDDDTYIVHATVEVCDLHVKPTAQAMIEHFSRGR